jgi:hypothetical protein
MARIRIALVALSAVFVGAGGLAAAHLAPAGSVATVPVTKSADPQPSGRVAVAVAAVPGGVPNVPKAPASRPARPAPAVPKQFTGLHMTFPRMWHRVTYEIRGPQRSPVQELCGTCPAADYPTHTADARITLMEWNP